MKWCSILWYYVTDYLLSINIHVTFFNTDLMIFRVLYISYPMHCNLLGWDTSTNFVIDRQAIMRDKKSLSLLSKLRKPSSMIVPGCAVVVHFHKMLLDRIVLWLSLYFFNCGVYLVRCDKLCVVLTWLLSFLHL